MDIKTEPNDELSPVSTQQESNYEEKLIEHIHNTLLKQESLGECKIEEDIMDSGTIKNDNDKDIDWQNYKNDFAEDSYPIKTERSDVGECSRSKRTMDQFENSDIECSSTKNRTLLNSSESSKLLTNNKISNGEKEIKDEKLQQDLVAVIQIDRCKFYQQNFVCKVCFAIFPSPTTLKIHKLFHKTSDFSTITQEKMRFFDKTYTCEICDFKSAHMASLKTHERSHTGEKPFECDKCSYKSKQQSNLNLHKKIHAGDKPFKCEMCDYKCARSFNLQLHIRSHTGERPFQCDLCEYKSSQASGLKRHKMSHSTEKPYKCGFCDYQCVRLSLFKSHKRYHNTE